MGAQESRQVAGDRRIGCIRQPEFLQTGARSCRYQSRAPRSGAKVLECQWRRLRAHAREEAFDQQLFQLLAPDFVAQGCADQP
jgi:hypothetical protein